MFGKKKNPLDGFKDYKDLKGKFDEAYEDIKKSLERQLKELEMMASITQDSRMILLRNEKQFELKMALLKKLIAEDKINYDNITAICSFLKQGTALINDIINDTNS